MSKTLRRTLRLIQHLEPEEMPAAVKIATLEAETTGASEWRRVEIREGLKKLRETLA